MVDPKQLVTVAFDQATAADHTVWTPPSGTRWVLYYLRLTAQGAVNAYLKSGTTVVSGTQTWDFTGAGTINEQNGGFPVAVGRATGEAFVITLDGAVAVDGFATLGAEAGASPTV